MKSLAAYAAPSPVSASVHDELERRLPPEPASFDDPAMAKRVASGVASGQSVMTRLRGHTAFKNPEIMGQLVNFVRIDERGTNFDPAVFDASGPGLKSVRELAELQNAFLERIQKEQETLQQHQAQEQTQRGKRLPTEGRNDGGSAAKKSKDRK